MKRTSKDSGFESPHTTSPLPIPNGPSLVVPSVASSNGAAAMSNGLGHINVSPYLNVSPSRKVCVHLLIVRKIKLCHVLSMLFKFYIFSSLRDLVHQKTKEHLKLYQMILITH